jgi:hypothetical protein
MPSEPLYASADLESPRVQVPNYCSLGPRHYLIPAFLIHRLREHFAARSQITNPELRDFLWRSEDVQGLVIESHTRWVGTQANLRPALVVRRNACSSTQLGVGDEYMGWFDPTGQEAFGDLMVGSTTVFCLHRTGEQAELLANEVAGELKGFSKFFRQHLGLKRFRLAEIDMCYRVPGSPDSYGVPVTVAYAAEDLWQLVPETPVLKRISLSALVI